MIRLTWMQFRVQALIGFVLLALIAVALVATGLGMHHLYATTELSCHAHGDCARAASLFFRSHRNFQIALDVLVEVAPGLIGLFWGAPLVAREFETGTYRFAWTATTPTRWMAAKLALVGLASVALAGVLSLVVTWWSSPLDAANKTPFASFDQRGVVPLAYAAFAFVLGVITGLLVRRTLPVMAITLGTFAGARIAVAHFARPFLLSPLRLVGPDTVLTGPSSVSSPNPRDWVVSDQTIDASGHVIGSFGEIGNGNLNGLRVTHHGVFLVNKYLCPNITARQARNAGAGGVNALVQKCVNGLHIREALTYQPINHYWPMQWIEFAIFLGTAALLGTLCLWWIRRRAA